MPPLDEAPTPGQVKAEAPAPSTLDDSSGMGLSAALEAEMDASFDAIPEDLKAAHAERITDRDEAGRFKAKEEEAEDAEQPSEVVEPSGAATSDDEREAKPPPAKDKDPRLEAALIALRLDKVPDAVIKGLSDAQILDWGSQAKERQSATEAKLRESAEEKKRAQDSASKPTEKTESNAPTVLPELDATLEAFKPYGDDFAKAQSTFGRAAVEAARKAVTSDFSPAVQALSELQTITREILNETMRREFGERFSEPVRSAKLDLAQAKIAALWTNGGQSYQDAAPTLLGRYRACYADACRLVEDPAPKPRDEGKSQRQAQGLPSSPGKKLPSKAKTQDEEINDVAEEVMARWASR